ncbi:MAG TPA: lipopolysaccharide transport periplasmic protein LptA [Epsilonproteobacteria bacterium]|nr:lipopolysaccharide transport periplasmic protein LptA [Campylobacterota bacterium]
MRHFWLSVLFLVVFVFADKIEVTAEQMEAYEETKEIHFIGNVKIKQNKSWLDADKVIVFFDENNETKEYQALGDVKFEVKEPNRHFKGKAQKVQYFPLISRYHLYEQATIDDLINKRHLAGTEIMLDMTTGRSTVKGKKNKPVRFIFDIQKSEKK